MMSIPYTCNYIISGILTNSRGWRAVYVLVVERIGNVIGCKEDISNILWLIEFDVKLILINMLDDTYITVYIMCIIK